jgi:hypothetical protein
LCENAKLHPDTHICNPESFQIDAGALIGCHQPHITDIMPRLVKSALLLLFVSVLAGCCISPPGPHNNWGHGDRDRQEHYQDRY